MVNKKVTSRTETTGDGAKSVFITFSDGSVMQWLGTEDETPDLEEIFTDTMVMQEPEGLPC